MYYIARWYDPYLNRWTQPDTIVPDPYDPQAWDRYSYALNNPIRYSDPSGHCVEIDDGLCLHEDTRTGAYHIVHPGKHRFANHVEVAIADFILSGDPTSLNVVPATSPFFVGAATEAACAGLGIDCGSYYQTRVWILTALLGSYGGAYTSAGYIADAASGGPSVPSSVGSDLGSPDCAGCGYVNPFRDNPADVLMPGGAPIGVQQGNNPEYRTLQSPREVMELFNALTVDATPSARDYPGVSYDLANGGWVGLRQSTDYGLTMDINIPGVPITKVHLPMP